MPKTQKVGLILIVFAAFKLGLDLIDGGGFSVMEHFETIFFALQGFALIFLRSSVSKVQVSIQDMFKSLQDIKDEK